MLASNKEAIQRKIIHIDMDAFYASVEQLDNPLLSGKPVAVGGSADRGVIAAASYEARKFGVRSAMSSTLAKKKCPALIFVKPRFERYKEISKIIQQIFYEYTNLVEPLALDEAFLDVTENLNNHSSATEIALEIRERIFAETGLRASAGISINKFTAKIASDINKPNGQKTIKPKDVIPFLEKLPINKFFGVGKVTAKKMNSWGIYNGRQLKQHSLEFLTQQFGKAGPHFYNIVRGIQNSPVKPNRIRKTVGTERTFSKNILGESELLNALKKITEQAVERLKKANVKGKTITLKIKHSDFSMQTRSRTVTQFENDFDPIFKVVQTLILQEEVKKSVRLLGVSISNLNNLETPIVIKKSQQLSFHF